MSEWIDINEKQPENCDKIDVKLDCGSVLMDCDYIKNEKIGGYICWKFYSLASVKSQTFSLCHLVSWRPHVELPKEGEE